MNTFIGHVKGKNLTGVAAAMQGEEAQGVPELSVSGGGARCSGGRWLARSGVVRWRSALRGGGALRRGMERKRRKKSGEEDDEGCPAPLFMGVGGVRLAFLPRTFPVTAARINRARSARLR